MIGAQVRVHAPHRITATKNSLASPRGPLGKMFATANRSYVYAYPGSLNTPSIFRKRARKPITECCNATAIMAPRELAAEGGSFRWAKGATGAGQN